MVRRRQLLSKSWFAPFFVQKLNNTTRFTKSKRKPSILFCLYSYLSIYLFIYLFIYLSVYIYISIYLQEAPLSRTLSQFTLPSVPRPFPVEWADRSYGTFLAGGEILVTKTRSRFCLLLQLLCNLVTRSNNLRCLNL